MRGEPSLNKRRSNRVHGKRTRSNLARSERRRRQIEIATSPFGLLAMTRLAGIRGLNPPCPLTATIFHEPDLTDVFSNDDCLLAPTPRGARGHSPLGLSHLVVQTLKRLLLSGSWSVTSVGSTDTGSSQKDGFLFDGGALNQAWWIKAHRACSPAPCLSNIVHLPF